MTKIEDLQAEYDTLAMRADDVKAENVRLEAEVERLNKHAMHLLIEDTRTWICPMCSTEWIGAKACDDDPMLCPECETPMLCKSVVKDEEIERLKAEVERLQNDRA